MSMHDDRLAMFMAHDRLRMSKRATLAEMMEHLLHAGAEDWQAVQLWTRLYYAALRGVQPWEPEVEE